MTRIYQNFTLWSLNSSTLFSDYLSPSKHGVNLYPVLQFLILSSQILQYYVYEWLITLCLFGPFWLIVKVKVWSFMLASWYTQGGTCHNTMTLTFWWTFFGEHTMTLTENVILGIYNKKKYYSRIIFTLYSMREMNKLFYTSNACMRCLINQGNSHVIKSSKYLY